MLILTKPEELRKICADWHKQNKTIALVPTMGFYHSGHEALMRHGRKIADKLVVSLFVNPAQFGPGEDLAAYPRNLDRDRAIAQNCGADILFAPDAAAMYSADHATWVECPNLSETLCGIKRPGHFRGVCTVVLKLFLLTGADIAVFGQKDWQQQAIIKKMADDLNVPVKIESLPAVREKDGLAMSSRNIYLDKAEREQAAAVRKGLLMADSMVKAGETDASVLQNAVLEFWSKEMPLGRVDYLSIVDAENLKELNIIKGSALMACAVYIGKARLIDNILLNA